MVVLVVPAVLAGLLGILASGAADAAAYVPRLRFLFLGSVVLGYVGAAVFVWRRLFGARRWGALLLALAAVRVAYLPVLSAGLLLACWVERLARAFGPHPPPALVHYALACFVAVFAGLAALLAVAAAAHLKKIGWVVILLVFVGMGVLAFWHAPDRTLSPHPLAREQAPAPTTVGPDYFDVTESRAYAPVTRLLAAGGLIRHAVTPRSGWSGAIRDDLLFRFRGDPVMSLSDRVLCLEAAMLAARRTSPRTPPE